MLTWKFLPDTGRGTVREANGGGGSPRAPRLLLAPTTMLRMVPLPVPGRI